MRDSADSLAPCSARYEKELDEPEDPPYLPVATCIPLGTYSTLHTTLYSPVHTLPDVLRDSGFFNSTPPTNTQAKKKKAVAAERRARMRDTRFMSATFSPFLPPDSWC